MPIGWVSHSVGECCHDGTEPWLDWLRQPLCPNCLQSQCCVQVKGMTVIRLSDDAFVQGAFEVPVNLHDSFTMLPLRVMGNLVH